MPSSPSCNQRHSGKAAMLWAVLTLSLVLNLPQMAAAQPLPLPGVGVPGSATDPRHAVEAGQAPWRALGRVQTELGGRCTGVLLSPRLVLTAAHCLYLARPRHFVQPGSVHFLLRYQAGRWAGQAVAAAIRVAPGYDPLHEAQSAGADWAMLTLAMPAGAAQDVLRLSDSVPPPGSAAMLGGYGQDRAEILVADTACRIVGALQDAGGRPLLRHSCAATRGTSGAPLLVRDAVGDWRVAGVQVLAEGFSSGGLAARP